MKPLPAVLSSTALTALDPMSRPTIAFALVKPNTVATTFPQSYTEAPTHDVHGEIQCQQDENCDPEQRLRIAIAYSFVVRSRNEAICRAFIVKC